MQKRFISFGVVLMIALVLGFTMQDKTPVKKFRGPVDNSTRSSLSGQLQDKTHTSIYHTDDVEAYSVQDFESATFPPTGWTLEFPGSSSWSRFGVSGYGVGTGSALFDFYDLMSGSEYMETPTLPVTVAGDSLKFDHAYATYTTEVDQLVVQTSINNGGSYTNLVTLNGGPTVGTGMVTAPATFSPFSPTASQWGTKKYALPVGTNKIRFNCISAYGNNLYLDNISIGTALASDVGTSSINIPSTVFPLANTPKATVKNYGTATQSFNVTMTISPGGYTSTQAVATLTAGSSQNVNFATWTPTLGTYTVKCYTQLGTDGNNGNDTLTATVQVSNQAWETETSMPLARDLGTGVGYSRNDTGWVFVIGGELATTSVQKFNIRTNTWAAMANLPLGKDRLGSALLKDSVYSIGGSTVDPSYTTDFYKYDINANTWVSRAALPTTIGWCKGLGYQDSLIYVAGGYDGTNLLATVYLYNSKTNSWRTATPLPVAVFGGGFAASGDTLVYVSGTDAAAITPITYRGVISQTDRSVITWTTGASVPAPVGTGIFRFDAHSWGNRGIILTGGSQTYSYGSVTSVCFVYSPGANTWTAMPNKTTAWTAGQSGVAKSGGYYRLVGAGGYSGTATITNTEMLTDLTFSSASSSTLNITMLQEGFYNTVTNTLARKDSVTAYLRNTTTPYAIVDSSKALLDSLTFTAPFQFNNAVSGTYYIVVKYKNTLETWSKPGGEGFIAGTTMSFNFSTAATQAYGSNEKLKGSKYTVFSGDVNFSGNINLTDITAVFNAASTFTTGNVITDLTGDNIVGLADITVVFNNSAAFVTLMRP